MDEIEKTYPDVFNILLQVMDYGYLTDNNAKIVTTTNSDADQLERGTIGFSDQNIEQESLSAIKHYFSAEFRNRLDVIIQFNYLECYDT
ncbi:AAA family ATPase [Coxiella-like endosymbiont of Rhipicephalus sanguineus]|uniref:AAA family ATPase n=1 Tax=Coxiella-like endosymbiont of Rhipicephalus sanguineus TaxID=1955402 RepID=UPI00203E0F1A|nr:AAA family ATPase [Coxiella-like endosymbiont of Rhipicephalus sanguineus]